MRVLCWLCGDLQYNTLSCEWGFIGTHNDPSSSIFLITNENTLENRQLLKDREVIFGGVNFVEI